MYWYGIVSILKLNNMGLLEKFVINEHEKGLSIKAIASKLGINEVEVKNIINLYTQGLN